MRAHSMESSAQMTDPSLTQATLPTSDPSALGSAPKNQRARRMPGRERRSMILTSAAGFFAERGFSASTRKCPESTEFVVMINLSLSGTGENPRV